MATKKKSRKKDPQLVAHQEDHQREVNYIHYNYGVPKSIIEKVMKKLGKNGKWCRSRKMIYAALRELGYPMVRIKKTKAK